MSKDEIGRPRDETVERYLLGRLRHAELASIESRLFQDESFYERLRDAEDALIDRYLSGELSDADREAFEAHFATSATRRDRIAFARAMRAAPIATTGVGERTSAGGWSRRIAWTGVAATVLIAIVWLVGHRARRFPQSMTASPAAISAPGARPPEPAVERPPIVLRLQAEVVRSAGTWPRLDLPVAGPTVRLQADLDRASTTRISTATLARVGGASVWQRPAVVDEARQTVHVDVPANLFEPGDYVVTFSAPGTPDAAEYFFAARASRTEMPR